MDLTAYKQIADLSKVAEANGIDVPRLRGYRWMGAETPQSEEETQAYIDEVLISEWHGLERIACNLLEDAINRDMSAWSADMSWKRYHEDTIASFEYYYKKQIGMWNKYAGRKDVLMIHSRMGGKEVETYDNETKEWTVVYSLEDQPWFLDHVYDAYDSTYCDIYAKLTILPDELKEEESEE